MKYFVFVDESGNNSQEDYFAIGCVFVPVPKIGEYYNLLNQIKSKITTKVKVKELELESNLFGDDLINFYKGRRKQYEIKFKSINKNTYNEIGWLITQYFKFDDVRFCCLIIDKSKYPDKFNFYDSYTSQLAMLIKNNLKNDDEIVLLPDDISISGEESYENTIIQKVNNQSVFGVHRIESHSSIFIQLTDVLTGAVLFEFKNGNNEHKRYVVNKIKSKLNTSSLNMNKTINNPNYFSIWEYSKNKDIEKGLWL